MLQRIPIHSKQPQPLWNATSSKAIEHIALSSTLGYSLMQRAGLSIALLARAIAPHAQQAWILCGPGNNGGDGLVAAQRLAEQGLDVWVHWLGNPKHASPDTHNAWQQAQHPNIHWLKASHTPHLTPDDVWIDALLGLGQHPSKDGAPSTITQLLAQAYDSPGHSIAVDSPTGLDCSTGQWLLPDIAPANFQAASRHTLSLLTLKSGLFTAHGRDVCGQIWWDDLGCTPILQDHPP